MAQNFPRQDLWWLKRGERHEVIKPQSSILLFHPIPKQLWRDWDSFLVSLVLTYWHVQTRQRIKLPCDRQVCKLMSELPSGFRAWVGFDVFSVPEHWCLILIKTYMSETAFFIASARPEASQGFVLGQLSWEGARTRAKLQKSIRGHPRECFQREMDCLRC